VKTLLTPVAAALLLLTGTAGAATANGKPVRNIEILFVAPGSFDELWGEAEVIAHVRVIGSRPQATSDGRFVHTHHRAKVLDVLKSDISVDCAAQASEPSACAPAAGHELLFLQQAGEIETADAVIRLADTVPLSPGSEYILFLRWDAYQKAFLPFFGPNGVFEVRDSALHPTGVSDIAQEQRGRSVDAFKEEVRAKGRKR
jgi:hypothetical protein